MSHIINKCGYLELIIGPMYSGKTSRLINIYNKCLANKQTVMAVNFAEDVRYSTTMLSTHDRTMIPCVNVLQLQQINTDFSKQYTESDVILINEGQFFSDVVEWVKSSLKKHKTIYVCGLDGDYKQDKFGDWLDLIPLCDNITKQKAKCKLNDCNTIFG